MSFCALTVVSLGCAKSVDGAASYPLGACQRVAVIDAVTKENIVGVEDMAIDRTNERLFISAYDRRKAERAARKNADLIPQGGVYEISLNVLSAPITGPVSAASIVNRGDVSGGLRPHGISYDPLLQELGFINRAYRRKNGKWRMTPQIERVGANGAAYVGASRFAPCSANDLVTGGDFTLVSYDHAACDWRAGVEDMFFLKRSGVANQRGEAVYDDASFANGMTQTPSGEIALAVTREKSIIVMKRSGDVLLDPVLRITTPGGPDNLTIADDGAIVAAVHPSLIRLGAHRRLGIGHAPSRIIKADPQSGRVELLFEDRGAERFEAATVAVEWRDILVAGSATDDGLLVCRKHP